MFGYGKTDYSIKSSDKSLFADSHDGHSKDSKSASVICSHHWLEHEFAHAKEIKAKELGVKNFDDHYKVGILVPFFRGTNSDMNTTLALALCAMFCIHWWGFKYLGLTGHAGKFINFKNGPINFFVGILGLELFVGLIQGLIFSMLTLVFASISTVEHNSDDH